MKNQSKGYGDPPAFRIWLCGAFRVERLVGAEYEAVRTAEWGGSSYPRLLLKALLCCPGRQARREALTEMLWPDVDPDQAVQYLNTATTKLRKVLQPVKRQENLLLTEDDYKFYLLAGQPLLWVDVDEALALLNEAEQHGRTSLDAVTLLERTADHLGRGSLLEEEEGEWVIGRRATVARARYRCRIWLAEAYTQQSRFGQAEIILSALLEEDPTDEDVLCRLMGLLHRQGMTHQALRLYESGCKMLTREGLEPTEATKNLAVQLASDKKIYTLEVLTPLFVLDTLSHFPNTRGAADETLSSTDHVLPMGHGTGSGTSIAQIITEVDDWIGHAMFCQELQLILTQKIRMTNLQSEQWNNKDSLLRQETLLTALATLPQALFTSLQQNRRSEIQPETFLPRCTASLTACWFLINAGDLALVEQNLLTYLPMLEALAQQYSKYQPVAATFAAQGCMLQAILTLHRLALSEREHFCRKAINHSQTSGDSLLQAGACMYLGYTYCYQGKPEEAIHTFLQALRCLGKLQSLLRSDIYMGLAYAYGQCKEEKEACDAITLAQQYFPTYPEHDPSYLYASCGLSALYIWEGRTYLALGEHFPDRRYYQKAWDSLEQITGTHPASERDRTEIIIYQSKAALGKRDLVAASCYLDRGLSAAEALGSKRRVSEACEAYLHMRHNWPDEPRILSLTERFRPYLLERIG